MKELKYFRRDERKPVQNLGSLSSDRTRAPGLVTRHTSLITCRMAPVPRKIFFFQERSQTLPVIIDDLEKTNPKRTQTKAKRTQIKPDLTPSKPNQTQKSGRLNPKL
jgi:hypothetical protein